MAKFQKIGRLRHRLTLKKQSDDPTGNYDNTTTYKFVAAVWGDLVSISGQSYYSVRNLLESTTHTAIIRFNSKYDTMGENDHLVYCGRLFRILSAQIYDERKRFIHFELSEMGEETSFDD